MSTSSSSEEEVPLKEQDPSLIPFEFLKTGIKNVVMEPPHIFYLLFLRKESRTRGPHYP